MVVYHFSLGNVLAFGTIYRRLKGHHSLGAQDICVLQTTAASSNHVWGERCQRQPPSDIWYISLATTQLFVFLPFLPSEGKWIDHCCSSVPLSYECKRVDLVSRPAEEEKEARPRPKR